MKAIDFKVELDLDDMVRALTLQKSMDIYYAEFYFKMAEKYLENSKVLEEKIGRLKKLNKRGSKNETQCGAW